MNGVFNATWLMSQHFPAVQYAVPGVIPEGFTLLAGAPKAGKSWFALDLAFQIATGGTALGKLPVGRRRPVLYAALEDGPRRLQSRLHALGVTEGPTHLDFATMLPGDPIETLRRWMADAAGTNPVIILDTLGKVERSARGGETDYARDYRVGGELKALTDSNPGSSLVAVHHTRKAVSEDFLDMVSGTQGLAGSADSIVVLRRNRTETTGCLSVTSRDAAEGEYRVELDGHRWTLVGDSLEAAAVAQSDAKATDNVGSDMATLIAEVQKHPQGVSPKDLKQGLPGIAGKVDVYLQRAAEGGRIVKLQRGLYGPVSSVSSVSFEGSSNEPDTSDTPLEFVA
ncbi:AAA family ATPase [Agromyces sp. NPDC058064]|uniref:AAA family ATPase n=1 Tax=Agromyces sp. NPDC058064 TaxID=3346322 RepID=UPI0036DA9E0B